MKSMDLSSWLVSQGVRCSSWFQWFGDIGVFLFIFSIKIIGEFKLLRVMLHYLHIRSPQSDGLSYCWHNKYMLKGSSEYNQRLANKEPSGKPLLKTPESKPQLPKELLTETHLNPGDSKQTFYRSIQFTSTSHRTIKLGWKVLDLALEQVDLALCCFSSLQHDIDFPFRLFASQHHRGSKVGNQIFQDIWVEWLILQVSRTENSRGLEWAIYDVCLGEFLPRIRSFFDRYMSWQYMCSEEFEDVKVMKKFQEEVTAPLKRKLANFSPYPDSL